MMLDYLGEIEAANKIQYAIAEVIRDGTSVTRDLNPDRYVGTTEMTDAVVAKIKAL
jgi:isocitrate dehydrogenase (NAD+)